MNIPHTQDWTCRMVRVTSNCCSHSAFKSHTASGSDGVSCHMLRATARAITPAITSIFNKSLEQSKLPNDWKTSNVTPILKHGDPSSVLNYRPISLLPLLSKLLERIVHNKISNFLYSNKLLSNCQFGFRPRSFTQEALLSATHCWYQLLSSHRQVAAVFIDVKKAFDLSHITISFHPLLTLVYVAHCCAGCLTT